MSVLAIIQARIDATRLPGKVLLPLAGIALLEHVWRRTCLAFGKASVIVACPTANSTALQTAVPNARMFPWDGPEWDVLGRFVEAAGYCGARDEDVIVRVTADDPFKDPYLMRVQAMGGEIPIPEIAGEAFLGAELHRANERLWRRQDREHFGPLIPYRPAMRLVKPTVEVPWNLGWRWTMDYPADYAFAQAVYERLYGSDPYFGFEAVAALMDDPEIARLHQLAKEAAGV